MSTPKQPDSTTQTASGNAIPAVNAQPVEGESSSAATGLDSHQQRLAPRDPRDPEHPEYGKQQSIRQMISELYQHHGQPLSKEQLDAATAGVMRDAQKANLKNVGDLRFSENYATGEPNYKGNLIALERSPRQPQDRISATAIEEIKQGNPDRIYRQYEHERQQQEMQRVVQQQAAQQREQQQQQSQESRYREGQRTEEERRVYDQRIEDNRDQQQRHDDDNRRQQPRHTLQQRGTDS